MAIPFPFHKISSFYHSPLGVQLVGYDAVNHEGKNSIATLDLLSALFGSSLGSLQLALLLCFPVLTAILMVALILPDHWLLRNPLILILACPLILLYVILYLQLTSLALIYSHFTSQY
jgi:hypothetical protein